MNKKVYTESAIKTSMLRILKDSGCLDPKKEQRLLSLRLSLYELSNLIIASLREFRYERDRLLAENKRLQKNLDSLRQSNLFDRKTFKGYGPNLRDQYLKWLRKRGFEEEPRIGG